jgi:anti-sigma regulatory factor (Ser/Thr protein kinase)
VVSAQRVEFVDLEPIASEAQRARQFVIERLAPTVADVSDIGLMVSELVTNVIRHAHGAIRLSLDVGPPVRVAVHNHEAATDAFRALVAGGRMPSPDAPGGRGLPIVRALASRVGLEDDPHGGKVVWFEYDPVVAAADAAVDAGGEPGGPDVVEGPNSS